MWNLLIPALASLVGMKYQSNIANDPKSPIGSGTSPSMNPGDASDFVPVQGSDVKEFADFSYEDVTKPNTEGSSEEEQLLQMLMEAGINPEDFGIMGLAFGGPLKRENGGEVIYTPTATKLYPYGNPESSMADTKQSLFERRQEIMDTLEGGRISKSKMEKLNEELRAISMELAGNFNQGMTRNAIENNMSMRRALQRIRGEDVDYSEGIGSLALGGPTSMGLESLLGLMDSPIMDAAEITEMSPLLGLESFAEENPEMFKALIDAGLITGKNLMNKPKEQKGSIVSTNTLPGNAARRRSQFDKITPLSGSEITFAKEGSALNRKMFMDNQMPNGGAMHGPGGPKDDLIPVMASNGEYMLSKAAVDAAGDGSHAMGIARLEKFNDMGNRRYG
tara:strand:- start:2469 stop:3644 length:1176 start_codon:yes stop_codon:yes gene_type:complete